MTEFSHVWQSIGACAGETFHLVRGRPFTYAVSGTVVRPSTVNAAIHRSQFETAFDRMPLAGPGDLQDMWGPSYVFAILTDDRITTGRTRRSQERRPTDSAGNSSSPTTSARPDNPASLAAGTSIVVGGLRFSRLGSPEFVLERSTGRPKEYMPQSRFEGAGSTPLNAWGEGPFCKFSLQELSAEAGVYVLAVDGGIRYVGRTENLRQRWGPSGYGSISPRNAFVGGQSTNCKVNHLILDAALSEARVTLYFRPTADHTEIEAALIRNLEPPWNSQRPGSRSDP